MPSAMLLVTAAIAALLPLCFGALPQRETAPSGAPPKLRFGPDGSFKIVQLTDLHFGESERKDAQTAQMQGAILSMERPSLTVLSGDMVSGFAWKGGAGWFRKRWQQLTAPMITRSLPYASILGNHDSEGELDRLQIAALDVGFSPLSLTKLGPQEASGNNYYLEIWDSHGEQVKALIWMLDSLSHGCGPTNAGWGCVSNGTMQWVWRTAAKLPRVPSIAFIHIPLPQFKEMWSKVPTNGSKGESVNCPLADTGVFDTLREAGVTAIYSGHDHNNDYVGDYAGVRLGYGRKSGRGGYGPSGRQRGARVIVLTEREDPSSSATWIRQEDGSREDQRPSPKEEKERMQQDACAGKAAAAASQVLEAVPRAGEQSKPRHSRLFSTLIGWSGRV